MTVLMYVLGVLVVAFGIGLSIALHELGHLVPAKAFGVRCTQYMIGFGPTLWSRRRGETEYGVKAVPLGGFVRMIGMFPPRDGGGDDASSVPNSRPGRWAAMVDDARTQAQEEIAPGDEHRAFYRLSTPKKVVVMLGGPFMNLLIGAVLITGLVTVHGVLEARPGAEVRSVAACVTDASATATSAPDCTGRPPSPAAAAGLRPGDRILEISGTPIASPADVGRLVRPQAGSALPVVVQRGDARLDVTLTPVAAAVPALDAEGKLVRDAAGGPVLTRGGLIGTTSGPVLVMARQPLSEAPAYVGDTVARTAGIVLKLPEKLVGIWQAAFSDEQRDVEGPMSVVGVGRLAGEKASGAPMGGLDAIGPLPFLVSLLASLNIALFVFNLIPLMPLDGGHVAGALWEGIKRSVARVLRRPDPGYVDVAKGLPIAYAVSVLLIGMSALIIYADIVKPVRF